MSDELLPSQDATIEDNAHLTETTIDGSVVALVYTSENGSYTVMRALDRQTDEVFTMVGDIVGLTDGQDFQAVGRWETHREYGRQFRVSSLKPVLPTTKEGIARYLASGILPGVGEKLAQRIVAKFGVKSLDILDNYSSRLTEVEGLGKGRVAKIREAWKEHSGQRDLNLYMQSLGISSAFCRRIVRHFGDNAAMVIQNNPYQLTDVRGIGFRLADGVASKMGIEPANPFRLAAGVIYAIGELVNRDGHVCVPVDVLTEAAASVLEVSPEQAEKGIRQAMNDGKLIADGTAVYPRDLYEAEMELSAIIRQFPRDRRAGLPRSMPVSASWNMLNDEQCHAVRQAFRNGMSIITGGPGVGKTTVTREIVHVAEQLKQTVMLAAPTGRAAKRLSESTGREAKTIHRLLRWEPAKLAFFFNDENPLEVDLLIIDEISMVDLMLATALLRAVPPTTRVILVGDRDQLPSVGPGNILGDLLVSKVLPITHLSQIYRQGAGSEIILNAHKVNSGQLPDLTPVPDGQVSDFYWIDQEDPEKVSEMICKMVTERIPERFGFSPATDIQVLVPMNRGTCGAQALNKSLQAKLLPPVVGDPFLEYGGMQFRQGDRVMQTVNNYDLGVFNGDQGTLVEISKSSRTFKVLFDTGPVSYAFDDLEQLKHAFAITIHKSQGSEFPVVIVPVLNSHFVMLRRNLIYTAMTRAGKLLILIGSRRAMSMAVRNVRHQPRYTRLTERLKARH